MTNDSEDYGVNIIGEGIALSDKAKKTIQLGKGNNSKGHIPTSEELASVAEDFFKTNNAELSQALEKLSN